MRWIFSPIQDLTFILLTPLPILLSFAAAQRSGWMDGLLAFGLALAMAHYFPGILRAYGDRALFHRFRLRLILAPIFLIGTTATFAYLNLNFIFVVVAVWGAWHWTMQIYGFARIYDNKVEPEARTHPRLDQMICIMWFGTCVFVLNEALPMYVTRFYESGGPLLSPQTFMWFTRGWLAVTLALTVAYSIQTVVAFRQGRHPNPLKILLLVSTFVYLRYTASMVDRPMVGYVMFEAWHDIQYLAIVWMFNLNRAQKNPESGSFIRFMFRPRAVLAAAYIALCLLFGSLTHAWRLFENPTLARLGVAFVIGTALLHYYLDGFIWKIREKETRQALGVQETSNLEIRISKWAFARQTALWLLFAVPTAFFFVTESKGSARPRLYVYEEIVKAFPDSAYANYQLARQYQDLGRLREAKPHFERALAATPDFFDAHKYLGVTLGDQGDLPGARRHFEEALKLEPRHAELHNNLGIVLDEQGDARGANKHIEQALALDPEYALAHSNLGFVLTKLGDRERAVEHLKKALSLDPEQDLARKNLAELEKRQHEK